MLYIIGYVMAGFLISSITFKIFGKPDGNDDVYNVIMFCLTLAVWPLVVGIAALYIPVKLLSLWVNAITR